MEKRTALYDMHVKYGGKIVPFAGYELPVQYEKGILFEHNAVRNGVGVFDVSHMGEVLIKGENAENALQRLVTNRVSTIEEKQCRYTLMCYENGGIVDDLLIYKIDREKFLLIVNASNTDKDFEWIEKNLLEGATATNLSDGIAQIAIQGPKAEEVLSMLTDMSKVPTKNYHFNFDLDVDGINCLISSTGYTGEKGYEIYCANADAIALYEKIMDAGKEIGIEPTGLGARDTLRFESSMPLYGHELSADTLATEVGLDFAIKLDIDFIGRDALIKNPPQYKRVGLKILDRGIAREHCDIYDKDDNLIGFTTSGGVCPTITGAYAMARVKIDFDDIAYIDVRGRKLKAKITNLPFYKRG
jgi:aminomethyltransferase